jgi:arginine/lysine/histidine transporter system substrate-binding protein
MNIKNICIGFLALAACAYFYMNMQPHIKDDSVLIVGTSADFYPFCFSDEQGNIAGYDIDVITQIAHKLGKKIKLIDQPFNTLVLELVGQSIDLIAAGTTPTEERKLHVLFTDSYMPEDPLVVLSNDPINSLDELLHKHIIVCTGYTSDIYISKLNPEHETIRLKSPSEALLSLQSHAGDVFITAKNPIQRFLKSHNQYHVWQIPNTGETSSFAVNPTNQELCDQINKALAEMKADGSLQTLLEKWKIS